MFNRLRIIAFFLLILVLGSIVNAQVEADQHLASTHLNMHPNAGSWSYDSAYFAIASDDGVHILTSGLRLLDHLYADEFVYSVDWHPSSYRLLVSVDDRVDILQW
ncbi:MAG: hypothetical protein KC708_12355, partial [Anaerolineae bacterium]|nr:hypothetical protein [Anaerolineae bacterium]